MRCRWSQHESQTIFDTVEVRGGAQSKSTAIRSITIKESDLDDPKVCESTQTGDEVI